MEEIVIIDEDQYKLMYDYPLATEQRMQIITDIRKQSGYNNNINNHISMTQETTKILTGISQWPKFHNNLKQTGLSPYSSKSDGTLKWRFMTCSYIHSSPAIGSNGVIYVGSDDGNLYAIYPNGTLKWSYTTGNSIYSSPAIDSNWVIYIGSLDGNLYAIYPNGTLKWSYTTGNSIYSSPAIDSNGVIYVGNDSGKLYAIYPNGTLKWSYTTGGSIYSSPAIDSNGVIYVGSSDSKLYAFQFQTPTPMPTPMPIPMPRHISALTSISHPSTTVAKGATQQFIAKDQNGDTMSEIIWGVTDPTLGTITSFGLFQALESSGTATVTATNGTTTIGAVVMLTA